MVSGELVKRTAALASVVGHIGLKLSDQPRPTLSLKTTLAVLETSIWPFFQRAERAFVACSSTELRRSELLKDILTPAGDVFSIDLGKACSSRYVDFWCGKIFERDPLIFVRGTPESLSLPDLFARCYDPFVMGNLRSFVRRPAWDNLGVLLQEHSQQVLVALIGRVNDVFAFGHSGLLMSLTREAFAHCKFSPFFKRYSEGPFAPLEDAVKHAARSKPPSWVNPEIWKTTLH